MVCRAFTFINYHIPIPRDIGVSPHYTTIGFFDGLFTERLQFEYQKQDLKPLWKYTLKRTAESRGNYSYQNVFGFSTDEWNESKDIEFWSKETDLEYPLTFVIFLQLKNYMAGELAFETQCKKFNQKLKDSLRNEGRFYTYGTIDKNDFIVTIKARKYKETVKAIKALHATGENVIYSYTIFSINREVLKLINESNYEYLYKEFIDSICLKGITNSYDPTKKLSLDRRYYEFCEELVNKIYLDEKGDNKIYDILGDDDFRLIARNVCLGKLLEQYRTGGMFSYSEKEFRFYLYSSSMVLNSLTEDNSETEIKKKINDYDKNLINDGMEKEFVATRCEALENQMKNISYIIQNSAVRNDDEKVITFCHAIWQLLQSLKVLETAPNKKYDFWSLYHPLSSLVRILESKMMIKDILIGEYEYIYEFIHKISMTLHGTLRTDIQFFQIKDFNVIVHYAPAKLRAFYSIWVLKLSDFYNAFCDEKHVYSFIFSPGMYPGVVVRQIFPMAEEKERLMLITSPERHIYAPKWLAIVLAHEVSHFVGCTLRKRKQRHFAWLKITARILELELNSFLYKRYKGIQQQDVENIINEKPYIYEHIITELKAVEKEVRNKESDMEHVYHSEKSAMIIQKTYRKVHEYYLKRIFGDYISMIGNYLIEQEIYRFPKEQKAKVIKDITIVNNVLDEQLMQLTEKFLDFEIEGILKFLKYITAETFADLMAIFTLGLSMKEYILTYIKSEFPVNTKNEDNMLKPEKAPVVVVRIAIVINVIAETINKKQEWFKKQMPGFSENWGSHVLKELISQYPQRNQVKELLFCVMLYLQNVQQKGDKKIGSYKSLYNDSEGKWAFLNKELDFMCDKKIWNAFCNYLSKCAETYIEREEQDQDLQSEHRYFVDIYDRISNDSAIEVMQVIEYFLAEYDNEVK